MPKTVYVATMDTEHFVWIALGATEMEARRALRVRWDEHITAIPKEDRGDALTWAQFQKAYGTDPAEYYGAWFRRLALGKGYVDSESEDD